MKFLPSLLQLSAVVVISSVVPSSLGEPTPFEYLDPLRKYALSYEVQLDAGLIHFFVQVETTGYIGLGISSNGKMDGADLFIAGVDRDGIPYHLDAHGTDHLPVQDSHDDWTLTEALENGTHTILQFSRLLNTCDNEDYPITNDTTRLIWSYGSGDYVQGDVNNYHGPSRRGVVSYNFMRPPADDGNDDEWETEYTKFDVMTRSPGNQEETTYWCTIHRGPVVTGKTHIVGFESNLPNSLAQQHTHHVILMLCTPPEGEDPVAYFDKYVGARGDFCYEDNPSIPTAQCQEYLYVWAVGGQRVKFPEHVGYPFGEDGKPVYYMVETHYDNPGREALEFITGVSLYYTPELRDMDAGFLWHWHRTDPRLMIPPNVDDFVISTHCAPSCTQEFPPGGIKIFNVLLHSHVAGRRMKLRHFRDKEELPWIISDQHYDFNFQENKNLWEERTILPGDHMTVECAFTSTDRDGRVIEGGLSTREEMCEAIIWYYPRSKVSGCGSLYPLETAMEEYGVTNFTTGHRHGHHTNMPWIWAPESLAGENGTDYVTMLNTKFQNWTSEFIQHFRESRQFGEHEHLCDFTDADTIRSRASYPEGYTPHEPQDPCLQRNVDESNGVGENGRSVHLVLVASVIPLLCLFFGRQ